MTTFRELIKSKAIEFRIPFDVEFDVAPGEGEFANVPTETVAGIEIPVFGDLLEQEAWFFEILAEATNSRRYELQTAYTSLVLKFKQFMAYDSYKEAYENLFNPSEELKEDALFQEFSIIHQGDLNKIIEMIAFINSDRIAQWMRIAFLLASRVGGEWADPGKVGRLRSGQIKALNDFIIKETNGGVMPDATDSDSEFEDEGKEPNPLPFEITEEITGKSAK